MQLYDRHGVPIRIGSTVKLDIQGNGPVRGQGYGVANGDEGKVLDIRQPQNDRVFEMYGFEILVHMPKHGGWLGHDFEFIVVSHDLCTLYNKTVVHPSPCGDNVYAERHPW